MFSRYLNNPLRGYYGNVSVGKPLFKVNCQNTRLGVVSKYWANLSELINFYFPQNHQKIYSFRGNRS